MLDRSAPAARSWSRSLRQRSSRRRSRFCSTCATATSTRARLSIHNHSHGFDEAVGAFRGRDVVTVIWALIARGEAAHELPILNTIQAAGIRRIKPIPNDAIPTSRIRSPEPLKHDWLPHSGCLLRVLLDPYASPRVSLAPGYWIHVERPVIDAAYLEVRHPIDAFRALVRICAPVALRGREPAFVADGDHVLRVYGLDIA
jgi:hypothetical protein